MAQPRSKEEMRDEARTRILEAARQIVSEKGFDRLTLAEVGEAAGYSRGLPRHYFGTKSQLLYAIARDTVLAMRKRFERRHPSEVGLERLIEHVNFYFDLPRGERINSRILHRVLNEALSDKELREMMAGLNRRSAAGFLDEIKEGIREGDIDPEIDAESVAILVLATLRGLNSLSFVDKKLDRDALNEAFTTLLRRALGRDNSLTISRQSASTIPSAK